MTVWIDPTCEPYYLSQRVVVHAMGPMNLRCAPKGTSKRKSHRRINLSALAEEEQVSRMRRARPMITSQFKAYCRGTSRQNTSQIKQGRAGRSYKSVAYP